MRKHIPWARSQATGHLPDSRLGLLFTPSRMWKSQWSLTDIPLPFHTLYRESCFCFTVDFLPQAWSGKGWNAFILRCHYYHHMFNYCIFNIFKAKQKTGDLYSAIDNIPEQSPRNLLSPMQTTLGSMASQLHIHMMQNTWDKFMSLQFAWQPAFKSPRFAVPHFRALFAVL